jgi:hypothetical protein
MSPVSSAPQIDQLSYADRFQLAWMLIWPCAAFSLLYWLVRGFLGFSRQQFTLFDLSVGLVQLFFFSPWIVRGTVRFDFPRFHLVVVRGPNGEATSAIGYSESLSVAWLLNWRTGVIMLIVHGLVSTSVRLVFGARPVLFDSNYVTLPGVLGILRMVLQEALGLLVFLLWVNKAAIKKNYARFSLRLEGTFREAGPSF